MAGPRCFTVVSEAKVAGCGAPLLGEALQDSEGVDVVLLGSGPCLGEERDGVGDDVVRGVRGGGPVGLSVDAGLWVRARSTRERAETWVSV